MIIDPMTGWPKPFHNDRAAKAYLFTKIEGYLQQRDMPLWVLKDKVFSRTDMPKSLRGVVSIDMQLALTERACRAVGAEQVWSLDPKHQR